MRSDVIELVFVSGTQMCLNAHHSMLPTFGWVWHYHTDGNGELQGACVTVDGWQLEYVGRHPSNIYVFLFVVNSGINEMYSDLPFRYWSDVEKMISAVRQSALADKEMRLFDKLMYEMIRFAGEIAMEEHLEPV